MLIKKTKSQKSKNPEISEEEVSEQKHQLSHEIEALLEEIQQLEEKKLQVQNSIQNDMDAARDSIDNMRTQMMAQVEAVKADADHQIAIAQKKLEEEQEQLVKLFESEKIKGFQEGFRKAEALLQDFRKALATFNTAKEKILLEVKSEIIGLAIDIAKQLVNREVDRDNSILEESLKSALRKIITPKGLVQIHLNPEDFEHKEQLAQILAEMVDPEVKLIFHSEQGIDKGSCMLETQGGNLNASFSIQIESMKEAFARFLGHEVKELKEEIDIEEN
jgi:flagellar biosynthesis/type III secretory pathway protein FliH